MSYRFEPLLPPTEVRTPLYAIATKTDLYVDNGVIAHVTFSCMNGGFIPIGWRDVMIADHAGWPAPDRPDASFQPPLRRFIEIDLEEEGFDSVEILFGSDAPSGLSASGEIDGSIVRVTITTECASAVSDDVETEFAIHVVGTDLRNVVASGILHIVAGLARLDS